MSGWIVHPPTKTRTSRFILGLIAVMLAVSLLPQSSVADEFPTGPGLDWELPETHGLYINGTTGNENLARTLPSETGQPDGDREFGGSPFMQNLLSLSSPPATEAALLQGNLTVQLYAGLYAEGTQCKGQNFGFGAGYTTFYATVMIGDSLVLDNEPSESQILEYDWNQAQEFTIQTPIDTLLNSNDTITLDISVIHNCQLANGHLFWDTYDLRSGLQIDADLLTP
ncbi:MAG: hypothetical protein VX230_04340, partial [Candidatus Thermoplasmatota archaeon]|nr:hypothetical protein [Candidatus Thermoplasmatota archaeon]